MTLKQAGIGKYFQIRTLRLLNLRCVRFVRILRQQFVTAINFLQISKFIWINITFHYTRSTKVFFPFESLKVCPQLYANANETCRTEANPNECQKVVCLASAELNELNVWPALWTYFSLKYRLQTDSVGLFIKCSLHKWMMFNAPW